MLVISFHSCCFLALQEVRSLESQFSLNDQLFVVESSKSLGFLVYTLLSKQELERITGLELKTDLNKFL